MQGTGKLLVQRQRAVSMTVDVVEALRFGESARTLAHAFVKLREEIEAMFDLEDELMRAVSPPQSADHQASRGVLSAALEALCAEAMQISDAPVAREDLAYRLQEEFSSKIRGHVQGVDSWVFGNAAPK